MAPIAAVAVTAAIQLPLPVRALQVDPPGLGTADCAWIARCDDMCDYAIKDHHTNHHVPHAEWFCTHLAELLGIAGPHCCTVSMPDGTQVFGSRWEGGVLPKGTLWPDLLVSGVIPLAEATCLLSRIYAFDHFVHNVDRHAGNILARQKQSGYSLLAFDYSRAWTVVGFPLPDLPFAPNQNTVLVQRQLRAHAGVIIDPKECDRVLDLILSITPQTIADIIDRHPVNWLTDTDKSSIMSWWGSDKMTQRVDGIKKGVADGTYL